MDSLLKALGQIGAVFMAAVSALVLPNPVRVQLDGVLSAALRAPHTMADYARLGFGRRGTAVVGPELFTEYENTRECFLLRQRAVWPPAPAEGRASEGDAALRRLGVEIATRDRLPALGHLRRAELLNRRAHVFTDLVSLGAGQRDGVRPGAAAFTREGHLVGRIARVSALTSLMEPLGAPGAMLYCDVLGLEGMQGVIVGPWVQGASAPGGAPEVGGLVELQVSGRHARPRLDDRVVSSVAGEVPGQSDIPGGLPVGRVVGVEVTEEGYVRAKVRLWGWPLAGPLYVMSGQHASADEADSLAATVRYRTELRRLQAFESEHIARSCRQLERLRLVEPPDLSPARILFAVKGRRLATFHDAVQPIGAAAFGLRPGYACLQNDAFVGVLREDAAGNLQLGLLTSVGLAIRVEVVQQDGRRIAGVLAAAEGRHASEAAPEGWCLPARPRLQLHSLDHDGRPVVVPAEVVTASGGPLPVPAGLPVGRLISGMDEPFGPRWEVVPYADFGALDYLVALVPRASFVTSR